jgi:hypothetical protein
MACPNRKKDAMIIAEITRRKAEQKEPVYEYHTWTGDLTDIQGLGIDLYKIECITRQGEYEWTVQLRIK